MAYGELKVDSITFTDGGSDATVSVSGLVKNPTFSGNIVVNGNISGTTITGDSAGFGSVTGVTVTGTTANFVSGVFTTQVSGAVITGNTAGFTTVTGTTVTGTTANFVTVSGATVTGDAAQFTSITGGTAGFTTVTGTTVTGTTANFVTVSGTAITGDTAGFTTVTGTTVTGTTANFVTVSGTTVTGDTGNFTSISATTTTITSGVFASGTAAEPSVSVGTTDNGLYSPGTDQVAISTNGAQALYINADGDILVADGNRMEIDEIRARDGAGLKLFDDAGAGIFIEDGGNVGLGTSGPADLLSLENSSATYLSFAQPTTADNNPYGSIVFRHSTSSGNKNAKITALRQGGTSGGALAFYTRTQGDAVNDDGGEERLRITNDGKVGIGTTDPVGLLNISNGTSVSTLSSDADELFISNNGNAGLTIGASANSKCTIAFAEQGVGTDRGRIVYDTNDESLQLFTANLERARIDSSGRLLVGTSSARTVGTAGVLTQIESTGGEAGLSIVRNSNGSTSGGITLAKSRGTTNGSSTVVQPGDDLGLVQFAGADGTDLQSVAGRIQCQVDGTPGANDMPGRLVFSTTADGASSPTERMRISSDGQFRHFTDAERLRIDNDGKFSHFTSSDFQISNTGTSSTSNAFAVRNGASGIGTGTVVCQIREDGDIENTNNSYGAISDAKLKENVVDSGTQWGDLKALQIRKYNFKAETGYGTHTQIGLIAQEVELVSPGLVSESPDLDENGNDLGTVTKSVNYSVLYMKAVKALQEAMERIETLEAKVAALEAS